MIFQRQSYRWLVSTSNSLANMAQALFVGWALMLGLLLFLSYWFLRLGVWQQLNDGDPTGVSWAIIVIGLGSTLWCGKRAWELFKQCEAVSKGAGWAGLYRNDTSGNAAALLSERTHGPHETAWWFTGSAMKLGLIGTVVGFMYMALQIGGSQTTEFDKLQGLLFKMTQCMGIALYTTLVGLVVNMLCGFQLLMLDRLGDRLVAEVIGSKQDATETRGETHGATTQTS